MITITKTTTQQEQCVEATENIYCVHQCMYLCIYGFECVYLIMYAFVYSEIIFNYITKISIF